MSNERYSRQIRFAQFGQAGQDKLTAASVLLVGCGGLGTILADLLVRAGVGNLHLVDRDYVELSNLQRQMLFDTDDVTQRLPKVVAAENTLRRVNPEIALTATVGELTAANIADWLAPVDLVIDGTDNLATRYLVNDACVSAGKPWIYGAAVGSAGMAMAIVPGKTPCFRCLFPEAPPAGAAQTCDTAGVLAPILHQVAAQQMTLALQLLSDHTDNAGILFQFDCWHGQFDRLDMRAGLAPDCPCCGHRTFPYLLAQHSETTTTLCGRDAIQLSFATPQKIDLTTLAERLGASGTVQQNPYLLTFHGDGVSFTVFRDGRTVVYGTQDAVEARTIRDRYL